MHIQGIVVGESNTHSIPNRLRERSDSIVIELFSLPYLFLDSR
jgi:hypothetical protein